VTDNNITNEFLNYRRAISALLGKLKSVSPHDIEDILQETYIRTYQSALKHEIHFPKAFMVKTAIRLANHNHAKQNRTEYTDHIEDFSVSELYQYDTQKSSGDPERDYIKLKEFELMCQALNTLPVKCRRVLILKKIYGFSQKEISTKLKISQSTLEKHVAKGVLLCARFIENHKRENQDSVLGISGLSRSKKLNPRKERKARKS
jgi:RNA polymerase sigma-70 factor (ECF subfamily)